MLEVVIRDVQPVRQALDQAAVDQAGPGPGPYAFHGQSLFATQPIQACDELPAAGVTGLPATERVVVGGVGHFDGRALHAAVYNLIEARNGQPRQADRYLVTRADIQLLPLLEGPGAHLADLSIIQLHRFDLQNRCDAASPADVELHCPNLGQGPGKGIFPGSDPVRLAGSPARAVRALALAQHNTVAGERKWGAVPVLSPS
ncbi:hypothetical protein D3C77_367150 [compost metagenome]